MMNGLIWCCILLLLITGCLRKTNVSKGGVYCFLILVLNILLSYGTTWFYKTIVFSTIAFVMFKIVCEINVNTIIKAANPIYITSVVLLFATLFFPMIRGAHRYIVLGDFVLEPSVFIVFSVLPIAKIINKMESIDMKTFLSVAMIFIIQVFAALIQSNLAPIVIMSLVYLALLFKAKIDKRIKMSWSIPVFVLMSIIISIIMIAITEPYRIVRILEALLWENVDKSGAGFWLNNVKESLYQAKLLGSANIDFDNNILFRDNNEYVLVRITLKYGWLCLGALLASVFIFISNLYKMSNKIENSFARYSAFAFTTYFFVNALLHSVCEFFLLTVPFDMPLMSNPTSILIDAIILGLIINVCKNREKILVGRQLDIDYDSTDELLMSIENDYIEKLDKLDKDVYTEEVKTIKENIAEVRGIRGQWKKDNNSRADVTEAFAKYWTEQGRENKADKNLVFISFNGKDKNCAEFISRMLEGKGHKTWHYKKDMGPTLNTNAYPKAITEAIRKSKAIIIILSENSMDSMHVKNEICLSCAEECNGTLIMPIKIDGADICDEIYYYLCRQDISCVVPPDRDELLVFVDKVHEALRRCREKYEDSGTAINNKKNET